MHIEDKIRLELQKKAKSIVAPRELDDRIRHSFRTLTRRNEHPLMKKKVISSIVAAALVIPTGVFAGPFLADQIFGSKENILKHGGSAADYNQFEAKLQEAKKRLSEQEYEQFAAKLKMLAYLQLKTMDEKGIAHPDRLQGDERTQFEQVSKELEPFFAKLKPANSIEDQLVHLSIEESQKLVSFPIEYPAYLPDGFTLTSAVGTAWKDQKNNIPAITMQYENKGETILVTQDQVNDDYQFHMPQPFDKETDYTLGGYTARLGEKVKRGWIGIQILVPKNEKHSAYTVYAAGQVDKAELEKIVLSVVK